MSKPNQQTATPAATTSLSVPTTQALARPSFLAEGQARGTESLGREDMKLPFLRLATEKTPQVEDEKFERGVFFDSVTEQVYGRSCEVIVVAAVVGNMRFGEYTKKEGILCQAPDGDNALAPNGTDKEGKPTDKCAACTLKDWGEDGTKPQCMRQGKYLVLVPGETVPKVLILQSTNFPVAKKLNTILMTTGADTFASRIRLSWHKGEKSMIIDVANAGWAEESDYRTAEKLFLSTAKGFVRSQLDGVENEAN